MKKKNVILVSFCIILFFTACEKEQIQENFQEEKDALEQLDPATRALIDQLITQPWPAYITNRDFNPPNRIIEGQGVEMDVTIYGYDSPWELEVYDILNDSLYLSSSQIPQIGHSSGLTIFTFNPLYPTDGTKVAIYELRVKSYLTSNFTHLDVFIQFPMDMDFEIDGLRDTYFYHLPGEKTDLSLKYKQAVLKEPTDYIQLRVIDDSENVISNFSNGQQTYQLKFLNQRGTLPFYLSENDSEENRNVYFQHKIYIKGQMDAEWETYETAVQLAKKEKIEIKGMFDFNANSWGDRIYVGVNGDFTILKARVTAKSSYDADQQKEFLVYKEFNPGPEMPAGVLTYSGVGSYSLLNKFGNRGWLHEQNNDLALQVNAYRITYEYYYQNAWHKMGNTSFIRSKYLYVVKPSSATYPSTGGKWEFLYATLCEKDEVGFRAVINQDPYQSVSKSIFVNNTEGINVRANLEIQPNPTSSSREISLAYSIDKGQTWQLWDNAPPTKNWTGYDRKITQLGQ